MIEDEKQTCVAMRNISAGELRRTTAVDLLTVAETQVIRELVVMVHQARLIGLSWPRVERVAMAWRRGANGRELFEVDPDLADVDEWRVIASVEAIAKEVAA